MPLPCVLPRLAVLQAPDSAIAPATPDLNTQLTSPILRVIWITLALALVVAGLTRLRRRLLRDIPKRQGLLSAVRIGKVELISADRITRVLDVLVRLGWWVAILVALDVYLWRVLGLRQETQSVANHLRDYVWLPFRGMVTAIWDYLPNLLTIVLVVLIARFLLWLVRQVFRAVEQDAMVIPGFHRAWADPTYRLVRALSIGLALAIIFPLLPAYNSEAFKGLSIFGGFLLAFGSSGAVGNLVAGVLLTYTRAFQVGDRVQIGDTFGNVQEQTFLATRILTDRQQLITIPSNLVLNSAVTNFTRRGLDHPTVLHTAVTIGYDAPWRTVHELLLAAAGDTTEVLSLPEPFVWQRALNDFYVTYELNVATRLPQRTYWILDELHRHIQDRFFAAGVEIMSPHFHALRDGNAVAIPEGQRPPGYHAPAFRVRSEGPA